MAAEFETSNIFLLSSSITLSLLGTMSEIKCSRINFPDPYDLPALKGIAGPQKLPGVVLPGRTTNDDHSTISKSQLFQDLDNYLEKDETDFLAHDLGVSL